MRSPDQKDALPSPGATAALSPAGGADAPAERFSTWREASFMPGLLEAATAEFSALTAAERTLLRAAVLGLTADCGAGENSLRASSSWGEERVVRAEVLRWLCVDPKALHCIDLRGISLAAARVEGRLDLAYTTLNFPLAIVRSTIRGGLDLTHAESRQIALDGSYCGNVQAHGVAVRGGISMRGVRAAGTVDISSALVSDNVDCGGARFLCRGGVALNAEHSNIGGKLLLNRGFRAYGTVSVRGAAVGDDFDCAGGAFLNAGRAAIVADGLKVGGSANFEDGFRTNGMVSMQRATVGADVTFRHAAFLGRQLGGVDLSRAAVEGRLVWAGIEKTARTTLDLSDARFEQLADEAGSWPTPENFAVEGCAYNSIAAGLTQVDDRLRMLRSAKPFSPQAYTQLAEALRRQGRERQAVRVMIERELLRREHENISLLGRFFSRLFGLATGYGYKAYRVMFVPAFFVLAGWLLFALGYRQGVVLPSAQGVYEQFLHSGTLPPSYPPFNSLVYSLDTFLPLTDFHQEDYWYPNPRRPCRSWERQPCGTVLHWYLGVHILAGWVFAILGIAGLLAKPRP
jgi:hypothetical protein